MTAWSAIAAAPAGSDAPKTASPEGSERRRARRSPIIAALLASATAHASIIFILPEASKREGMETKTVSLDVVLDAPPAAAPRPGAEVERAASAPQMPAVAPEDPVETVKPASNEARQPERAEPLEARTVQTTTPSRRPDTLESGKVRNTASAARPAQAEPAPLMSAAAPSPSNNGIASEAETAVAPVEHAASRKPRRDEAVRPVAEMAVPADEVPLPTPRPAPPPKRMTRQENPRPAKAPAPRKTEKARPPAKPAHSRQNASRASAASRRGGATAGQKAAYARRLARHVERYKRYPPQAQRQGLHGTAGLSITIDRGGRLISARVTGSAGAAILDQAAKAVARRAAPYPPPPQGIGAATITFSVALRFSR